MEIWWMVLTGLLALCTLVLLLRLTALRHSNKIYTIFKAVVTVLHVVVVA